MDRDEIRAALTGPIPSTSTPFRQDGEIDFDAVRNVVDFHIAHGARTVFLTAGDSHYICMSEAEIAKLTKVVTEHTAGRAMVVAADRHYGTSAAVAFAQYARSVGVDVLMVMPPDWGASTTPETLAEHYGAVAAHIPVMLVTNLFVGRGLPFGLATLERTLESVDGVVAVKDDFCGLFGRKMALLVNERWAVMSGGQKTNHMDVHPYGCDGYLSTYMRFKPEIAQRYWAAVRANDLPAARAVIRDYDMPLFDFIGSLTGGFDAGVHGILELFKLAQRWRRKPYYSLNDEEMERLAGFLKDLGVL